MSSTEIGIALWVVGLAGYLNPNCGWVAIGALGLSVWIWGIAP